MDTSKLPETNKLLIAKLETLLAIELLEYHDMNHLSGDNKTRNEDKRMMLQHCIEIAGRYELA